MAGCCDHDDCCSSEHDDTPRWRRVLVVAFAVNAGMFLAEVIAGLAAGSTALQADALDFLSDAANYAISLGVAGMALRWRSRAAIVKGVSLAVLAAGVLVSAVLHARAGALPAAETMGVIGLLALAANTGVAVMLYRYREGDSNRRSVWICSRNDAIGNIAVMAAALGVFGTDTIWPDIAVAVVMALLGLSGGLTIVRQALSELRQDHDGDEPAGGRSVPS